MTSVASLRLARANGATAYADFIKHQPLNPARSFIFVEGKDDCCFYAQAVITGGQPLTLVVGEALAKDAS